MQFNNFAGVFLNTITVILGSSIGLILRRGIPEKISKAVMTAIGLCTVAIGICGVVNSQNQLVMIISLVVGSVIGTLLNIDGWLKRIGDSVSSKTKFINSASSVEEGFVSASLLFCIGAMTIVGSINAGIYADNQLLYTKSILDLISSMMLAASLGIGVLFSAAFVFVFQGLIVMLAALLGSFLSDFAISEMVCVGSVMIFALGLNLIGITKIKVADLLPSLLIVPLACELIELLALQ